MKTQVSLVALSAFLSACVPANDVFGHVSIIGGQSQCTDEDGDPLEIEVRAFDSAGDLADEVTMKCGGEYGLALEPGTYRIKIDVSSPDPLLGFYFIEDSAEETVVVVDGQPARVPTVELDVD